MSNEIETRYLVVTLPYTSWEEADSVAGLIDTDVLTDGFTSLGTVEHALGLVHPDGVRAYPSLSIPGRVALETASESKWLTPAEARALAGALLRAAGDTETVRAACGDHGGSMTMSTIECTCVHDCRDCSNSGDWHQHATDPCTIHPDAEVS